MISNKDKAMVSTRNSLGNVSRTKVNNDFNFRTTFSSGYLFPVYASEVLPSENKKIYCGELVRSITPLGPTMDNSFLDIFFFFVPKRLLWDHWEEFIAGYNKEAWAQDVEYTVPKILFKHPSAGKDEDHLDPNVFVHSFLDYLPGAMDVCQLASYLNETSTNGGTDWIFSITDVNDVCAIDALYPRAYVKIWNDWFRDENLQDELQEYTGDNDEYADAFAFNLLDPYSLPKAAKYHNRFTSALPSPVKGPDVLIPMNDLVVNPPTEGLKFLFGTDDFRGVRVDANNSLEVSGSAIGANTPVNGTNLYANNVSNTIRMLRLATQTELLLARDARGGTRYVESLLAHFGVHNGDARLQRSEYLGSKHIPLNVTQVTNTAGTATNPLGNVGGQSVTKDNALYFSKGFTEHGIVLGLAVVRTNISYSSGIRKQYQRFTRFEHIWPEFKHVGDVPLYTKELALTSDLGSALKNDTVFGYTPYGSELREGYNYNNGLFRAKADGSLSYLTYQEDFSRDLNLDTPVLSSAYIEQPVEIVSNTLVSQTGPQFYALFNIHEERIIPLDPTSDPGLMDHF